ncbi:unnamed protein product [Brugia timori]|uniref:LysM domain-containing protein n=1 Tax=Brugia timori TaxID=42155 RepID=A0A0R3QKS7_9BILA|nr:unnamed protein product [Brugia timori]
MIFASLMEYTVAQSDSIERIAAVHDCTVGELMKMNRLATRMVFPGQKLLVPYPLDENDVCNAISGSRLSANQATITAGNSSGDRIRRGPGMAVQVCGPAATRSDNSRTALEKHRISLAEDETNTDCMKRFIKLKVEKEVEVKRGVEKRFLQKNFFLIKRSTFLFMLILNSYSFHLCNSTILKLKVKQMTEVNGTVTGTLLVTPSALMFDPDVIHPLVLENGQDLYIMMARMEEVISVTMFKSAAVLIDTEGNKEFHDLAVQDPSAPECSTVLAAFREETVSKISKNSTDDIHENTDGQSSKIFFDDMDLELKRKEDKEIHIGHVGSDFKSLLITDKGSKLDELARTARRTYSDLSNGSVVYITCHHVHSRRKGDEIDRIFISGNDKDKPEYCSQPSTSTNVARTGLTCNPLSKLGRTLSFHANTIRGSVTSGAERMTQSAMSGTKSVAQGVVSQSKAVAGEVQSWYYAISSRGNSILTIEYWIIKLIEEGSNVGGMRSTLQTGIQTSVKVAASHAKTAVGVVTTVPQGIASMGSGLFSASQHPETFLEKLWGSNTVESFSNTILSTTTNNEIDVVLKSFDRIEMDKAVSKTRKEQNLATLLSLKEKAQKLREEAMKNKHEYFDLLYIYLLFVNLYSFYPFYSFFCATSTNEMINLFKPVHELPSATQTFSAVEKNTLTDLPYYMVVRLNRKKKCDKERFSAIDTVRSSSATTEDVIANDARQEFWFAIPKHKVDAIYHFLLQWNPEKYGSSINESVDQQEICEMFEDCEFVVLDSETSEKFASCTSDENSARKDIQTDLMFSVACFEYYDSFAVVFTQSKNFFADSETAAHISMHSEKGIVPCSLLPTFNWKKDFA